jgi:hypothetical protein
LNVGREITKFLPAISETIAWRWWPNSGTSEQQWNAGLAVANS